MKLSFQNFSVTKETVKIKRMHPPGLVPCPFWRVDSKRRLVEAGVRVIFRDSESQRVPRTGSHSRGHCRYFGLHGDQGTPGRDRGDVAFL